MVEVMGWKKYFVLRKQVVQMLAGKVKGARAESMRVG
jgi:hypothetical protein